MIAADGDHLQPAAVGEFAAVVEIEIERDIGLRLVRREAAEWQGEHVHRVTDLEAGGCRHERGLAAGVEEQRIDGADGTDVAGNLVGQDNRLNADIDAEIGRRGESRAIVGNGCRVHRRRHEELDERAVTHAVRRRIVEGKRLREAAAQQDVRRARERDDSGRGVEHRIVGSHRRHAERHGRVDGAGGTLQRPVATQRRKAGRIGRCGDANARQRMKVVHEGSARGAGTDVAAPELDLRVVGQAVAPAGDVLRPGVQGRVRYGRSAELDLASLAIGQEVDLLDAVHPLERLGDLPDAVERRVDDHDLGVGRDAVGQRFPSRHARIDEQDGVDGCAGRLRTAIGLTHLVAGGRRVRVVLLCGVLRVLYRCGVRRLDRRIPRRDVMAGSSGGRVIRCRSCRIFCNIIVFWLR